MDYLIKKFSTSIEKNLSFINMCKSLKSEKQTLSILDSINKIIPLDTAAIFYINSGKENNIISNKIIDYKGHDDYWKDYERNNYLRKDPIVSQAMQYNTPIKSSNAYDSFRNKNSDSNIDKLIKTIEFYNLNYGVVFALNTNSPINFTLFYLHLKPEYYNNASIHILSLLLPHAHRAIHRLHSPKSNTKNTNLTNREIEVLKWIVQGKTSWETGKILSITERTVKFHLNNTYQKLDVSNRTQAIATAMNYGLV